MEEERLGASIPIQGSSIRLWERLRAGVKGCEKGDRCVAKQGTRITRIWAVGLRDWSGRTGMPGSGLKDSSIVTQRSLPGGKDQGQSTVSFFPTQTHPLQPHSFLLTKIMLSFLISFKKTPEVRFCTKIYIYVY